MYKSAIEKNGKSIFSKMKYFFDEILTDKLPITKSIRTKFFNEINDITENIFKPDLDTYSKYFDFVYKDLYSDKKLNNYGFAFWKGNINLMNTYRNLDDNSDRTNYIKTLKQNVPKSRFLYRFPERKEKLKLKFGINTVGFNRNPIGVAEVSRSFIKNLYHLGIPNTNITIDTTVHSYISDEEFSEFKKYSTKSPIFDTNILFCNADTINNVFREYPVLKKANNNIGVFWWEFEDYFNFPNAFDNIDEVLSFSSLVTKAVRKVAPKNIKIKQLLFPFVKQWEISHTKEAIKKKYNISNEDFVFFFNFDFYSSVERKNPFGIINAFYSAFADKKNVKLIFKSIHSKEKSSDFKILTDLVSKKSLESKVVFINESLSKNMMMSIINSCDVYISMHKSEGFGIGMLEAMFLSKPVIATNYGGNTDFMNHDNSLLLKYKMTEVINDFGPYKKGWLWAEPDFEQAVEYMKKLYYDRAFATNLGEKAYYSVKEQYSMKNIQLNFINYLKYFFK
jgi:glycosyltransferase involved in cell wall biosynthesis